MKYFVAHKVHISLTIKIMEKKISMMITKMLKLQQPKNHGHEFVVEAVVVFVHIMSTVFHQGMRKPQPKHIQLLQQPQ